ncbi:MAG: ABC transporter substrate-binding protein [Deltaproteobacteria bacterium]|jgi:putative ABC transport system substrate-binding protein|nr:ABC transporter substrate-binding protein [Deltaproteobacteria bacterium]
MKKLLQLLTFSLLFLIAIPVWAYDINVLKIVEHPSLNLAIQGFQDYLKDNGIEATYKEFDAQGKVDFAQQSVTQMLSNNPDLILTVGTMVSQQAVNKIKEIPILFTAVTDPLAAELVSTLEKPGGNVTGTSDITPLDTQISIVRLFQPEAKTLGVIYNPGEVNSVVQVEEIRKACLNYNFTIIEAVAAGNEAVIGAAQSLISKVDAIFLPSDNTAISSYESIMKVGIDHKIPIYCVDGDSIAKGGTASLNLEYYQLGRQTGEMAIQILKNNVKPGDIPVGFQRDLKLTVNETYNNKIGFVLPKEVEELNKVVLK